MTCGLCAKDKVFNTMVTLDQVRPNTLQVCLLTLLVCITLSSCNSQDRHFQRSAEYSDDREGSSLPVPLSVALAKMFAELSASYGNAFESRPIELTAETLDDEWIIRMVFIPKTPGAEFIATVDKNGNVELIAGW